MKLKCTTILLGIIIVAICHGCFAEERAESLDRESTASTNSAVNSNHTAVQEAESMNEDAFWEIIEHSKEESDDFAGQIRALTVKLSRRNRQDIVDFEYRFREMLEKSCHYNLLAAAKIILGWVTDDSFLYFQCRLIAEGRSTFYQSIENPDCLAEVDIPNLAFDGEDMLVVADNAFMEKFGRDTDQELPRDVATDYLSYDFRCEILGEDWEEKDLPQKYPRLWDKYR